MDNYILLGLNRKEVKIMKVKEEKGIIMVELTSRKKKVKCPTCEYFTKSIHDIRKPIQSKYLDSAGTQVILEIVKRRFTCHKCKKTFTEKLNLSGKDKSISNKLKIQIRKDLLDYNLSMKKIAEKNHVSDYVVRKELEEATSTIPNHIKNLPKVISFDEFKADTNKGKYAFILNDPIHKKVLEILPNRKKEYLIQYFTYTENRHSVEFVISDMYEPYLLVQKIMFTKAKYVVDRFHYIRYVMDALDKVRIRWQKEYGEKSKEYKLLKNKKNVSLLRRYSNEIDWWVEVSRYKNGHMVKMLPSTVLDELLGINDEIKYAYQLKETFLDIINHSNYEIVKTELKNYIDVCRNSGLNEFIEVSNTIENWLEYICNSFIDERYSNGFTEGTNNKIKVIKRIGFGYKNFDFFRKRVLYIFNNKVGGSNGSSKSKKGK